MKDHRGVSLIVWELKLSILQYINPLSKPLVRMCQLRQFVSPTISSFLKPLFVSFGLTLEFKGTYKRLKIQIYMNFSEQRLRVRLNGTKRSLLE